MENHCNNRNQVLKEQLTNKYQRELTVQEENGYLDYLINPRFQGLNRIFVLSFEINDVKQSYTKNVPQVEIKDYNGVINGRNFFSQPVKII